MVLGDSWWLLVGLGGSWWLFVVLGGSRWFLVVLCEFSDPLHVFAHITTNCLPQPFIARARCLCEGHSEFATIVRLEHQNICETSVTVSQGSTVSTVVVPP